VMAHRLLSPFMTLPPLIHHEDGFNEDEAERRNWKRNAFRRLALPTASALVVPSQTLERIAQAEWGSQATFIRNGIDTALYRTPPDVAIPGLEPDPGAVVIGTVAGLRKVKNLTALVAAVRQAGAGVRLAIVGEGPEWGAIAAAAADGWDAQLVMPGFMAQPHRWIGHFDILALSSLSEQAPIAVIEAMAAGRPIASLDVGDIRAMVADENQPFIAADQAQLTKALARLAADASLRQRVGAANAARAAALFDEAAMVAAYSQCYGGAIRGRALFGAASSGRDSVS
jgi:L-malate glycosyltransferase